MDKLMTAEKINNELAAAYIDKLIERLLEKQNDGYYVAGYLGGMLANLAAKDADLLKKIEELSELA